MAAYLFGKITVSDPSWLPEYEKTIKPQLAEAGAKYLMRSIKTEVLESDAPRPTATLIIEFPSMEAARNWYNSPEYQRLVKLRQGGSVTELFLAEGV